MRTPRIYRRAHEDCAACRKNLGMVEVMETFALGFGSIGRGTLPVKEALLLRASRWFPTKRR